MKVFTEYLKKLNDNGSNLDTYVKNPSGRLENCKEVAKQAPNIVAEYKRKLEQVIDNVLQDPSIDKENKACIIINATALVCGIIAVQPIPFADVFILTPIQLVMVTALNKVMGNPFEKNSLSDILTSLLGIVGWGVLAQQLILGAYKTVIPFLGAITTVPLVYAATFSLGEGAKRLIQCKVTDISVSDEELKKLVKQAKEKMIKERKNMSIKEAISEFTSILENADDYQKYKDDLMNCEQAIEKILDNNTDYQKDVNLNNKINNKISFIKNRVQTKYPNVEINEISYIMIALLPNNELIEKFEMDIAKISRSIEDMNCIHITLAGDTSRMELVTEVGVWLVRCKENYQIEYIELADKFKDNTIIDYLNLSNRKDEIFRNGDIKREVERLIRGAQFDICIVSPWVNDYVKDDLLPLMQQAVNRGVKFKVLFGIKDNISNREKQNNNKDIQNSRRVIQNYINVLGAQNIRVKEGNTHVKLIVCDNTCYLLGSYNYLSFKGIYDSMTRDEIVIKSYDKKKIEELRKAYFSW